MRKIKDLDWLHKKMLVCIRRGDRETFNSIRPSNIDFSGVDFSNNNFSVVGYNLNGANLDGANLDRASLYGASLDGATLDGATLYRASLNGASLNGANLDGANLDGANLDGVTLNGANLDFVMAGGIGSNNRQTIYLYKIDRVVCGCFDNTMHEFIKQIKYKYSRGSKHYNEYKKAVMFMFWSARLKYAV